MIVVAGHLVVAPEHRADYLVAVGDVCRLARSAPGCLDFVQVPDPIEADRIVIFERWESDEALLAFRSSGSTDDGDGTVPPPILGAEVHRYVIAEVTAP